MTGSDVEPYCGVCLPNGAQLGGLNLRCCLPGVELSSRADTLIILHLPSLGSAAIVCKRALIKLELSSAMGAQIPR